MSALRSCVQIYRPLGFEATLSFLASVAGPFDRDEAALMRALDLLAGSRALWHLHLRRYTALRRAAKRRGNRTPPAADLNPNLGPAAWYGAERRAALHALEFWRRKRLPALVAADDPGTREMADAVAACVASRGAEPVPGLPDLVSLVEDRIRDGLYQRDSVAFARARDLLTLAHLVATAVAAEALPRPAMSRL
ncbi:hypothetical protein AB0M02_27885 [Actinoplanes sp. NPDC051861]|uniref:hypothetical protein n=1 Tax=Actinoplanes sp. NPDC051861 TaxID=3155170 RepID=UPI0034148E9D